MINLRKKKLFKIPFPIIQVDDLISNKSCEKLRMDIEKQKEFDDLVMNGRNRINKGSSTFNNFLSKSVSAKKIYDKLNSKDTFNKILKIFNDNFHNFPWRFHSKKIKFSKLNYGKQKGKVLTFQKKKDKKQNVVNLDIDFSISNDGYFREPHRDRSTRIINFLIYLNSIPKKNGGTLEIFNVRDNYGSNLIKYQRFPNRKSVKIEKKFQPKKNQAIFFLSSPNSYHGVSKFISKNNIKRIFIYGSFSLNKRVKWSYLSN